MSSFLDKTIAVRQILRWARISAYLAILVYIGMLFSHSWDLKMGGVGFRASPYYSLIPPDCRRSASFAGVTSGHQTWIEQLMLKPSTWVYSLPESEKKLGFGMRGLPCRGYNFLMLLHGSDFKQVDKYVDESGAVVAIVTTEILKPYREPVSNLAEVVTWPEMGNPSPNDASLTPVAK